MKSKKILKFLVTSILVATVTTSNVLILQKEEKNKNFLKLFLKEMF